MAASLFCCMSLGNTACVNRIDEESEAEIEEGTTPITFSIKMEKASTKVTNTAFEKGDRMGLFATTSSGSIKGKRYIDNLALEYTEGSTLVPKKTVFYPEGDVSLDFISYHPYQTEGVAAGTPVLPVSVQIDQSNEKNRAQSDFLVAKAQGITSKTKSVTLEFQHKLSKLAISLTPDASNSANDLLKANPRIIATGLKTSADYNLEDGTFSNLTGTQDIIASGEWSVKDNKLTGKEFIIIPQTINDGKQSFIMEWSGRIYSCAIPEVEMSSSTQCIINISAMQSNSNVLSSFAGKIKEWSSLPPIDTDNMEDYTAIHISALSFSLSNVYRIYHEGIPIAEVCKEYLKSASLTSRAVIAYPIGENEKTDLSNGVILQLADRKDTICGGRISWNTDDYGFTYTKGEYTGIDKLYIDNNHKLLLDKPENAIKVNVACYTLRDIRKGVSTEYPIVKIGAQYWMGKELHATTYRDGAPLKKQSDLGTDKAGYYKPDKYDIYFYNGESILAGELAPVLQARKGNAPVVVSMATAVTLRELDAMLGGGLPLIRIMPNTPAAVGAGTILYAAQNVTDAQLNAFRAVLAQAGLLLPLPEEKIDAASAISGCGPAFCFQFADALALGGVRAGLSYPDACRLAAQTMLGAAEMLLQGGEAPDVLKMRVCSPAGTTIEGVLALEQGGFSYTVQNAVTAAYRRTVEMTKKG